LCKINTAIQYDTYLKNSKAVYQASCMLGRCFTLNRKKFACHSARCEVNPRNCHCDWRDEWRDFTWCWMR